MIGLSNSNSPVLSAAVSDVNCSGGASGSINLTVTGGTSPYLYTWNVGFPIVVNAGIFNGSGLTNQKDYWTKGVNYSAKAQFLFPNVNLVLSTQKIVSAMSCGWIGSAPA